MSEAQVNVSVRIVFRSYQREIILSIDCRNCMIKISILFCRATRRKKTRKKRKKREKVDPYKP